MKHIKTSILFIAITTLLLSCGGNLQNETSEASEVSVSDNQTRETVETDEAEEPIIPIPATVSDEETIIEKTEMNLVEIQFDFAGLIIDDIDVWEDDELKNSNRDTTFLYLELGSEIEGKTIEIKPIPKGKIKVYQRHKNSITIMNEGPHCDLLDWKHYHSEWKEIPIQNNRFKTIKYTRKDREKFLDIGMDELKKAVSIHCEGHWADLVKNIKAVNEYPSGVGISHIFLKLEYKENPASDTIVKTVSFEIPMGC